MSSVFDGVCYVAVGPQQWLERPANRLVAVQWLVEEQRQERPDGVYRRKALVPRVVASEPLPPATVQQMLESVGLLPLSSEAPREQDPGQASTAG